MISLSSVRERLAPLLERGHARYELPLADRARDWFMGLTLGDRAIATVVIGLVVISSISAVIGLERHLLAEVPAYGGSIAEGIVGSPRFINPLLALSDADRDLAALTYAGLMGLSGAGELIPVIADHYEVSADGKTYTFTIRDKARFSDGSPLTADDVVFTVTKAQDPSIKSPEFANWSGVRAVALDPRTVQFTLARPYAPFLALTTLGILPQRLWGNLSASDFSYSSLETNPVGAGPFVVSSVKKGSSGLIESVKLTKNVYYALGRPYLDSISLKFYANADDLGTAFQKGAVDSAYDLATPTAHTAPYARVFGVFLNQNENQVFTHVEVRKALSLALDRGQIIEDSLGGYATPVIGPVPPHSGITPAELPPAGDAVARASQVLTSAGWRYDSEARSWTNGKTKQSFSTLTLRTSNVPELKSVASAVKTAWQRLGIKVTVELYESGDLSQNIIRPRKYEALLYGMVTGRSQDLYPFWSSSERNDPGLNIALYANKTVDSLLEDARTKADPAARKADLQKIETTIAGEYPAAFIYAPDFTYSYPSDLRGVTLPQIVTPSDRFADVATWYRVVDHVWPFLVSGK